MPSAQSAATDVAYSVDDLIGEAARWGYRTTMEEPDTDGSCVLASGRLSSFDFSSGIRTCFARLDAHRNHQRGGVLGRSLSIRLVTSDPDEYRLSRKACHAIPKGGCIVLDVAGELFLSSRQSACQTVAGLFMDACPERILDDELAERVNTRLCGTQVAPLMIPPHLLAFADAVSRAPSLDPIIRLRIESCALELLACALEPGHPCPIPRLVGIDRQAIGRVRDYILAKPSQDHSLDALARLAGMSASTLKRKFPLFMGQSVFEFIRDARLDQARSAIEDGDTSIKQAAWMAGYVHTSNFSTAYRRKFGHSPSRSRS